MTVRPRRRTVPVVLAWLAGAALTLLSAAPATAHATLLGTDPADGASLEAPPAQVTLTFNEPVRVADDGVRLLDASGDALPATAASVDRTVELGVPPDLPDGAYVVDWRVISADGHPVSGALTFTVGTPADAAAEAPAPDGSAVLVDVLRQTAQVLVYVGILGAAGLVLFRAVLLDRQVPLRLLRPAAQLAAVAALGLLLHLALDGAWRAGAGLTGALDPALLWSTVTSAAGVAAGVAAAGLALALGSDRRLPASAGAVLALLSLPLTGHSRSFGPGWLVMGSDVLHVLAGSVWFGGLLGLVLTLRSPAPAGAVARTVARFSGVAAWVVLALAVSGTLLAWRIMPGLGALTGTGYGLTLLVKVGAVACIVAIAAWNRFRLVPRVERDDAVAARSRLRRTVAAEAWLLVVVLGLTGVLVSRNPMESSEQVPPPAATGPVSVHEPLGEGTVDVHVAPATTGPNTIELRLQDADGAALEPAEPPRVRLRLPEMDLGPLTPEATPSGPGSYVVDVDLPLPGAWELELGARVSTYESPVVVLPLEVAP